MALMGERYEGEREAELQRLFELAPDMLAIADARGYFTRINPAWERTLGWSAEELTAVPFLRFVHEDDLAATQEEAARALGPAGDVVAFENRYRTRDGGWRWLLWNARWDGERWYAVATDISARKELEHHALHDPLTGLANRALVTDRLQATIRRMRRYPGAVLALLLDVDDLTLVNDIHGHQTGDGILRQIADRLRDRIRVTDTVGRFGGDSFLVVAEGPGGAAGIDSVIERVRRVLDHPLSTPDGMLVVTGCIGVAVTRDPGASAADLLRDADVALHRAKLAGRGRSEVYDARLAAEVRAHLALAGELRGALGRDELRVVFQPLVALAGSTPVGYEALLRWNHPVRGELAPGAFLQIAEEDGLIVPIGSWVLQQACRQVAAWRAEGRDLWVSVNVSARQLSDPELVAVVEDALEATGVPPGSICLEVTETTILGRPDIAAQVLAALRELGVRVALDDFGLGYSSLTHLKALPVDVLKVDRSFIAGLQDCPEDRAVVEAVLTLARRMGVTVIAEGVETLDQDAVLRELGCPMVQGFLYGRPSPPELVAHSVPAISSSRP
jgi:diguanylate cyclase (GGDEF)-like protein/PAS domain S-box-containing protein